MIDSTAPIISPIFNTRMAEFQSSSTFRNTSTTVFQIQIGSKIGKFKEGEIVPLPLLSSQTDSLNQIVVESSTEQVQPNQHLSNAFQKAFEDAVEEQFEDGMESDFSRALVRLVRTYKEQSIKVLSGFVHSKQSSPDSSAEALRWLGQMDHPQTFSYRLWLLVHGLASSSVRVRDGALLGLSFLDSPKAIPYLEEAAKKESCSELRTDIVALLSHLRANESGKTASKHS